MTRRLVAVVMGGTSAEREVSMRSGMTVLGALPRDRFDPVPLVIDAAGRWHLGAADAPALAPEAALAALRARGDAVAFLALHGPGGEDGTAQGFFETAGIAYTGAGVGASAIAMDKVATRALLERAGVRVAPGVVVHALEWERDRDGARRRIDALGRPLFVKAPAQGSSYGVTPVRGGDAGELDAAVAAALAFEPRALVERAIEGVEVTLPVLGNAADPELQALLPVEIRPRSQTFFDYREKYAADGAEELCPPASLAPGVVAALQLLGALVHRTIGCDGMSRTDAIVSADGPVVLEVNTIPGFTERSLLPRSAAASGIPFPELCAKLVNLAVRRFDAARAARRPA